MNRLSLQWRGVFLVLLGVGGRLCHGSYPGVEVSAGANAASVAAPPDVCESKTINYITHTLPQQCLRTSWTSPAASSDGRVTEGTVTISLGPEATQQDEPSGVDNSNEKKTANGENPEPSKREEEGDGEDGEELATSSFMSFEEWKEMMLRKSGQDPDSIKGQKQREHRERDPALAHADLDSIGDDGEISLDFDVLSDKVSEMATPPSGEAGAPPSGKDLREEQVMYVDGTYRSKDAGKTCKERFSFSSFDAGATILKTSPGAKSPNSILVENKDSYMLLECQAKNKFVIVELSDDILVDTVVLANYEFFSSMIRRFRISVSARYPVKLDKWVDLGTFEARNSRDIQAFLISHPQIYTKYIRIEFLSHYGTEYYCPVSLLRVHGTRMLDTWKEPDNSPEDEIEETIDAPQEQNIVAEKPEGVVADEPVATIVKGDPSQIRYVGEVGLSPWQPMFEAALSQETCMISSPTTAAPTPISTNINNYSNISISASPVIGPAEWPKPAVPTEAPEPRFSKPSPHPHSSESHASPSTPNTSTAASAGSSAAPNAGNGTAAGGSSHHRPSSGRNNATDAHPSASSKIINASSTVTRNKTSTAASAASASPTVQESFFKAVTKRLQNLESNTSLSLQYIEDQSRFLQDALQKMEKKQISRVDAFLDSLNRTVLTELRNVRTQYDQIWQSTVLALETQREQNQREIVALSSRLNILADEVVFQKRMAILQSVLLLSCLVLVIFSRGYVPAPLDMALNPQASMSAPALMSPMSPRGFFSRNKIEESPPPKPPSAVTRMSSNRHPLARSFSYNDKVLPLTPTSDFSREGTPIIQVEDVEVPFFDEVGRESFGDMTPPPTSAEGMVPGPDSIESTPDAMADRPQHVSPSETEPVQPLLRHSHSAMSQLGGAGARKPLPALPEDPS